MSTEAPGAPRPRAHVADSVERHAAASAADWGMAGHGLSVAALQRALAADRLAHAYLFSGPAGVGKATLARRLAQALCCERRANDPPSGAKAPGIDAAPCRECRACIHVEAGTAPDIERIAIGGICDESGPAHRDHAADGSTRIRICQVRRLERVASLAPFQSPRRIFVIDTADDLQREAAHALLKTLEEPPASVLLILLAADASALLPTVRSRCQELVLRPLPRAELAALLAASHGIDAATADELALAARGRYGLALRLHSDPALRQLRETAAADAERLATAARNERFDAAATLGARWYRERQSVLDTLDAWAEWWRACLARAATAEHDRSTPASACTPAQALAALRGLAGAREQLLANVNAQLALDILMLDLPQLTASPAPPREEEPVVAAP
ncbi:MAG: AAA family ATPase [Dehalococcoidia bacterium]|nr:AAA family ATPase [Dehalococcoidia bacterium]